MFAGPRIELYPLALWQDYLAISGARTVTPLLIHNNHVERLLLRQPTLPCQEAALAADAEHWTLEYRDTTAVLYRRR